MQLHRRSRALNGMPSLAAHMFDDDEPTEVLDTLGDLISSPVVAVPENAPLAEARRLLLCHRVPALAVLDAEGALRGIVTRTDVLRGLGDGEQHVREAMSGFVFALTARATIEKAAALMAYEA